MYHSLGIVHPGRGAVEVFFDGSVAEEGLIIALQQEGEVSKLAGLELLRAGGIAGREKGEGYRPFRLCCTEYGTECSVMSELLKMEAMKQCEKWQNSIAAIIMTVLIITAYNVQCTYTQYEFHTNMQHMYMYMYANLLYSSCRLGQPPTHTCTLAAIKNIAHK